MKRSDKKNITVQFPDKVQREERIRKKRIKSHTKAMQKANRELKFWDDRD